VAGGNRRIELLIFVLATLVEAVLLGSLALGHGVNPDEGFYLAGAWRVLQGDRLYADFFFPQMPYLPYVQAVQIAVAGPSIVLSRMVSVIPGALTLGVLCTIAWRWSRKPAVVATVALAYAGHVIFWNYLTVTKTYGLANLWLVWAFVLIASRSSSWRAAAAGLCGGLAIGTRLPAVAVVGVLFLWVARQAPRRAPIFAAGAVIGLLPCLWIASRDFDAFWFGNYGFHSLRRELTGVVAILQQKVVTLGRWLFLPQNLVLWVGAGLGAWWGDARHRLALACALMLALAYLSATPTYLEYTAQIIPFLLLASLPVVPLLWSRRSWLLGVSGVYVFGLLFALRPAASESYRGRKLSLWRLDNVEQVANYLHREAAPDDAVLSWWEGYPVLARRPGFGGVGFWESNVAKKLDAEAQRRYHVRSRDQIKALVETGRPRLVVFPDGSWEDLVPVLAQGYQPVERFGALQVYRRAGALRSDEGE